MIYHCHTENDTQAAAKDFATRLKAGDIVLLNGDLGMGKTVFARALIRTLTGQPELDVPSPTFTLVQTYTTPSAEIWHFDLYRLKDPEELYEIGWEEALSSKAILLIEWSERLDYLTPENPILVSISQGENPNSRVITTTGANNHDD